MKKLSNTEAELKKSVAYKKKFVGQHSHPEPTERKFVCMLNYQFEKIFPKPLPHLAIKESLPVQGMWCIARYGIICTI